MIPAHHGALPRTVASGVLVAVATLASMFALGETIELGAWNRVGVVGVVLVAGCTALTRWILLARVMNRAGSVRSGDDVSARRQAGDQAAERAAGTVSFVATLVGLAVATWYLLVRYGTRPGDLALVVGIEEWHRIGDRFTTATEIMLTERAPVADSLPIGLVAVGGTLLMFLVADSLAGARMPALAALPLLVLWTPALSIMGRVPTGTFVIAVTATLLLLTIDQSGSVFTGPAAQDGPVARARRSRAWITALSAGVVAVLGVGAGAGVGAVGGVANGFSQLLRTQGQSLQLADRFDMRAGLGERSSQEVLTYEISDESQATPLRERTFTQWDGRRVSWDPRDGGLTEFTPDLRLMAGTEELTGESTTLDVTIVAGRDGLLPVPLGPRTVDISSDSGAWLWDPVLDEIRADERLDAGTRYTVQMLHRGLTAQALRSAPDGQPVTGDFTAQADTEHRAETTALALEITAGAGSRYDQALALQNYLHHEGGFTYSTDTAPARTDDATWDFLTDRRGYCVQFSTAFLVMARALDIPTRLGVGYLPGSDPDDDGVWSVTGEDSHAWPEVWFEGIGWVRFEPTPQVQTGPLPDYADPASDAGAAPNEVPEDTRPSPGARDDPDERPTARPEGTATPATATDTDRADSSGRPPWWVWTGAALLVLVIGAGMAWIVRSRRGRAEPLDPERAWRQVVVQLEERGVVLAAASTLRQAPREITEQVVALTGRGLPDSTTEAVVTLARAAEEARYARRFTAPAPERLDELVELVSTGIQEVLGDPRGGPSRAARIVSQALRR